MSLETVVRPYQTGNYAPGAVEIQAGFTESRAPIRLLIGINGTVTKLQASWSTATTIYVIRRPAETQTA